MTFFGNHKDKRKRGELPPSVQSALDQTNVYRARWEDEKAQANKFESLWLQTPTTRAYVDEDSGRLYQIMYTDLGVFVILVKPNGGDGWVEIALLHHNVDTFHAPHLYLTVLKLLPPSVSAKMMTEGDEVLISYDGELIRHPVTSDIEPIPLPQEMYLQHLGRIVFIIRENFWGMQGKYGKGSSYVGALPMYEERFRFYADKLLGATIPPYPYPATDMHEYNDDNGELILLWGLEGQELTIMPSHKSQERHATVINLEKDVTP